jgi:enoyl-CoA hydratase
VPPFVLFERRTPRLAVVTLNNPARLNALHTEMVLGLHDVLDELAADSRCRVAAVNGPAVGGGFALAAASDLRIAGASASFCTQFIRLGVSGCDIGVSYTLPKLIGGARAAELIYTARRFDAYEAERIGFVSEVVAKDDLLSRAEEIASVMLSYSPFALEMTKQVFRANQDAANVGAAIALENRTQVLAGSSGDFAGAVAARAEGRLPYWATERDADGH